MLYSAGIKDFSLPNKEKITGKEIFSAILPKDFNFTGHSRSKDEKGSDKVVISNGKLTEGVMDKNNLGEGSGLLLRNIHKKYGKEYAIKLIGDIFKLGIQVLIRYGFSTAISDTDLPSDAKAKINEVMENVRKEVDELIVTYRQGNFDAFPGKSIEESLELKILELLNSARNKAGELVANYADKESHTMIMAVSGARGNLINLAQMATCVGQQALRGKRIDKGYNKRTLSCFREQDLTPIARGFITNGFKTGLTPAEFFFGSMTGRDSLMDTALRTPKSGYLYRRLANAMQDLKIEYDYTVRNASGRIVQFEYGEDGIDVSKSEKGIVNVKRIIKSNL